MKTKSFINRKYSGLSEFIEALPQNYDRIENLAYSGRNEVRIVVVDGIVLVIKYFKRMTLANRFIYANFRKSKAQRAFEYSEWLNDMGITSPESVAFLDCYKDGMLHKSFYVSVYTEYKPIKELFSLPIYESEEALKAFARFTYQLHRKGVFHYDYSAGNILFAYDGNAYDFALIDNNRMKISKYSFRKGIKTLNRLAIPVELTGIVAAEYSRVSGLNDLELLNAMVLVRLLHQFRNLLKKWVKTPIRYFSR